VRSRKGGWQPRSYGAPVEIIPGRASCVQKQSYLTQDIVFQIPPNLAYVVVRSSDLERNSSSTSVHRRPTITSPIDGAS
jgi:hypothetical protein